MLRVPESYIDIPQLVPECSPNDVIDYERHIAVESLSFPFSGMMSSS